MDEPIYVINDIYSMEDSQLDFHLLSTNINELNRNFIQ